MSLNPKEIRSRKNVILYPQNGNTFSPASGQNVIRLQLPANKHVLKNGSLKMNGQLAIRNASGDPIDVSHDVCFNNWGGMQTVIDSVTVSSTNKNTTMEHLTNYGRYVSKRVPTLHNYNKLNAGLQNSIKCSPLYDQTRIASQVDSQFSLEIMSAVLHHSENFSCDEVGGLTIEILLSQNPAFIFDRDATGGNTYSLTNVKFSAVLFEPTPEWTLARAMQHAQNGAVSFDFDSYDIRTNQLVSNNDSVTDIVNFKKLKSMSVSMMLASESNSQDYDNWEQSVRDVTECSLNVNGIRAPYKFALQAGSNTNKAMIARSYLEAVSHSKRPDYDGVRTILSPSNYADSSSEVPLFGVGYLFSSNGMNAKNTNLNLNVLSSISAQNVCYVQYDHVKTMNISAQGVTVSA